MRSSLPGRACKAVAAGLLAGLALAACAQVTAPPGSTSRKAAPRLGPSVRRPLPPSFAELAERLRPSVVHVRVRTPGVSRRRGGERGGLATDLREFFGRLFGAREEEGVDGSPLGGSGTGFLIGSRGEILTNQHVVEGAGQIEVRLSGGKWLRARLVGADARTDLALLRVKTDRPLPGARLGDSDRVRVGDWVLAIGNPFGLEETVTAGILSAKGRAVGGEGFGTYLQTDAPIHAGNSGGPLFNLRGEVVGVNTAVVTEATGIGFAIPINLARRLLPDLRRYGRVRRGWIGVSIQDLDPDLSRYFKVPRGEGVLITRVHAKSPSAEAGLRPGDVILSLGGLALRRSEDFGRALERAPIGAPTALEVFRGGKRWKVSVSVRELRDAQRTPVTPPKPARMRHPPIGVELRPLTSDLAERLGLEDPAGLLVFVVDPGSPADRAGMRRGDVIRSVGLQAVRTRQGLQGILRELKSPEVLVLLQRGDQRFFTLLNLASPSKSARNPGF